MPIKHASRDSRTFSGANPFMVRITVSHLCASVFYSLNTDTVFHSLPQLDLCTAVSSSPVCVLSHFSRVQLFVTLWTVARRAPLSMGFSRQEYWSGLPCSPPGDLFLTQGSNPSLFCLLHWQVDSLPENLGNYPLPNILICYC